MNSGLATADLESSYTYDNEGRMTGIQYPSSAGGSDGPNVGYTYDSMGRLSSSTGPATVQNATYGPSNELLSLTYNGSPEFSEQRTYNSMLQLTQLSVTVPYPSQGGANITYTYSPNANNGKIMSQTDNVSGEQVAYTYDALNRLASAQATSNSWGQSYNYDGFGNLTDQNVTAGTATSMHVVYNAANNQQTTDCADANGNISSASACYGTVYVYDVENRITQYGTGGYRSGVYWGVSPSLYYNYAPGNKRMWRGAQTSDDNGNITITVDEVTFWSVNGQKLGTYNLDDTCLLSSAPCFSTTPITTFSWTLSAQNIYFGAKLVYKNSGWVGADRLGSIGKYYPWGLEKPSATQNGTEKFTGYFRDAETGLDYAINRYHQPGMGRFMTADRSKKSRRETSPGSWNRYAYTRGDPVNRVDRTGKDDDSCFNGPCTDQGDDQVCDPGYVWNEITGQCDPVEYPAPKQPAQQQPTCSISLYERPVSSTLSFADHLYLDVTTSTGASLLIEGGPIGGLSGIVGSSLYGYDTQAPGQGLPGSGPGLPGNIQVGGTYTGSDACSIVNFLTLTVNNYNVGTLASYNGYPANGTLGYNSNSFAYTLLYDETGLPFSNLLSYFGNPNVNAWVPGWGNVVPQLESAGSLNGGN